MSPNLTVVEHRLGHSNIATTVDAYGHMVPSVDVALADGLSAPFAAKPAPAANNVTELR